MEPHFRAVLLALRDGEVATYGDIADDAGFHGRSRAVGRYLATTSDEVPWWRVVAANGRLVPGNEAEQIALLHAEGVSTANGRVRLAIYGRFAGAPIVRRRCP
jgi:methylated-DNA-protein-cysteine methyltransferase related protein